MGSNTVGKAEQEVITIDSPRVEGSSPVRGKFFCCIFFCFNTILADLTE